MIRILPVLLIPLLAVAACDSDPADPDRAQVAGSYEATTFVGFASDGDIDVLASGGSLEMTLAADGTTSGSIFFPGGAEGGGDFEADLSGTWSLNGSTVTFSQSADTFIRDVAWSYGNGRLTSNSGFAQVVLTRQ